MKPDKTSTTPLYIQIREELRQSIVDGNLKKGERLPAVTALAEEKGVTAATIRRALQDLIDEGLITSHVGRGTFVHEGTSVTTNKPETIQSRGPSTEALFAARKLRQNISRSLSDMMQLAHKPGVIAFTRGIGDPDMVESGVLARLAQTALSGGEEIFRDYGDPQGLLPLREAIADLYGEQNIDVSPDQILVTSGSQQAIALIAQQSAENGTPVICETPCYTGVTNAFSAFGIQTDTIIRESDGPNSDVIRHILSPGCVSGTVFYLCPVLHNPTGTDISPKKQKLISDWAKKYNGTVLADEVFRDLHFIGDDCNPVPESFLVTAGAEHSVILGSLSKSFISGLRVGWIVTSTDRIRSLTHIKKAMDLGCPPLMQGIAQAFLEDKDGYRAHRERVRSHYRHLRDITIESLSTYMPEGISWTIPQGGFQLWVTLPKGFSSINLFLRSVEKGAAFLPGPLQDINNRFMNAFRLCYGSLKKEDIEEGIRRLGQATAEYLTEAPGDSGITGLGDF